MPVYHRISSRTSPENVWPAMPAGWEARLLALLFQLQESQWLPARRLEQLQMQQLGKLVHEVRRRVPYLAALLDQAGLEAGKPITPEAWRRLPVLTKAELQRNPDQLTNPDPPASHLPLSRTTTSGSTARPVTVRTTEATRLMWEAMVLRELHWSGWSAERSLGSIRFDKSGKTGYPEGKASPTWGVPFNGVMRTGPGHLLHIATPVDQQIDWLLRKKPDYLVTYPTNALEIARAVERGAGKPPLRGMSVLGETVSDDVRDTCHRVFGFEVRDTYTTNETGYVAIQCPARRVYHVASENVVVEVVDADGRPCGPGEVGRVLITTLHNYAMPLLRYEIGDYAEVGAPCDCRRGLPTLARVMGRTRNMAVLPDGRKHWPVLSGWALRKLAPVLQHQVVQKSLEEVEATFVVERRPTPEEEEALTRKLQGIMQHPFRIVLRYVDEITRSAGGKYEEFKCLVP